VDNLTNTKTQRIFSSVPCIVNGFEGGLSGVELFTRAKKE